MSAFDDDLWQGNSRDLSLYELALLLDTMSLNGETEGRVGVLREAARRLRELSDREDEIDRT